MRHIIRAQVMLCMAICCFIKPASAQNHYQARLLDRLTREPVAGAMVKLKASGQNVTSNANGSFRFPNLLTTDTLLIQSTGYETLVLPLNTRLTEYLLQPVFGVSAVTVQTGYQSLPKERVTGSFAQVNKELLSRRISTGIIDRLDGVTSGILFNKGTADEALTIHGRSTLDRTGGQADPLIILDNFPYEGNIGNINPNDVESVTVLKDAAAASIWGARSGNGVIVITTKRSRFNQPLRVNFQSSITTGGRPDLYYSRHYLASADYIDIERNLFDRGYYNALLNNTTTRTAVTPVVELLAQRRSGMISEDQLTAQLNTLQGRDLRDQFSRHLYQSTLQQQYALQLSGGGGAHHYQLSAGYDQNREALISNGYRRFTLQAQQVVRVSAKLEVSTSLYYTAATTESPNPYSYRSSATGYLSGTQLYPYAQLSGEDGNAVATIRDYRPNYLDSAEALGFLPWRFRMLEDVSQLQQQSRTNGLILRAGLSYKFSNALNAELQFQQEVQDESGRMLYGAGSYYARNTINRYSQYNAATKTFTYPVPVGGILVLSQARLVAQNLRGQLNYQSQWGDLHHFSGIGGFEIRQRTLTGFDRIAYGYDEFYGIGTGNLNYQSGFPLNPQGNLTIPAPSASTSETLNRYVSFFANAAYRFRQRYTLTVSGRTDGANLFGVRTNERITPLWSAGAAWEIQKEKWLPASLFSDLKLRATYGFNGNAVNANSLLTASFRTSSFTGLPTANLGSAPNPQLRWEKVNIINIGLDAASRNRRISGTIEWYQKSGTDLIQDAVLAPSTGFTSFSGNGAATRTRGIDLTLAINVVSQANGLRYDIHGLLSTVSDQVRSIDKQYLATDLVKTNGDLIAAVGKPLFSIWSYPWAGLDPATGDPMGIVGGKASKNYAQIISSASPDSLVFHGSARPTIFGSLRQELSYRKWTLSVNITFKGGYYFRRRSLPLNLADLVGGLQHQDYGLRWKQPGDEQFTQVPSVVYPANTQRNEFYMASDVLVEKGDHIRLQDIRLTYRAGGFSTGSSIQVFGYLNNVGILWRANQKGIDPDRIDYLPSSSNLPPPVSLAVGIQYQF
ncbi:MAG: SusC/RagA family TonB-linked outer membrane protein [Bacteroidota bacterium]